MDMMTFIQATINGLMIGGIYALIALGLTMIYGVLKIINFAHGEFVMLGMYVTYVAVSTAGINPYLSILITIVFMFALGALIQKHMINRILDAEPMNQILLLAGLSLFMRNLVMMIFSPNNKSIDFGLSHYSYLISNYVVNAPRLIAFSVGVALCLFLYYFIKKTRTGKMIRASAQNRMGALLTGIDVNRSFVIAFGIGVTAAGIAGSLLATFYYISPTAGQPFVLTSFVIVVLGTMGNFIGALIGGLIIGLTESYAAIILSPSMKEVVSFTLFILILLFKPSGIFGGKKNETTI